MRVGSHCLGITNLRGSIQLVLHILFKIYVNFIQNICESLGPAHTKGKDLPRMWIPEGGESFGATAVSEFFDDRIRNFLRQ